MKFIKKKKRKSIWLKDIDPKIHMRIKLLAIADDKPMYQIVNELLTDGLEVRRKQWEKMEKGEEEPE